MIHAYNIEYVKDAMNNLGEAADYAVSVCHISMDDFLTMFITSGISRQFESGVPKVVAGMSGTELVFEVLEKSGRHIPEWKEQTEYNYSAEYWCGYILAYYQWHSGRSFKDIMKHISAEEILNLYPALHEASEEKFVDTLNNIMKKKNAPTRLQELRKASGYSQRELAYRSKVSLRSVQQYEQRAKDINKAGASNLLALSKVLGCSIEDLMEYSVDDAIEA